MRKGLLALFIGMSLMLRLTVCGAEAPPTELAATYEAALARWHKALDSPALGTFSFVPYFGRPSAYRPERYSDLNESVDALAGFGANMIPWMVEQIRLDYRSITNSPVLVTNTSIQPASYLHKMPAVDREFGLSASRIARNIELLFMLGGIQLRVGMTSYTIEDWLPRVQKFLAEWDAGVYANPDRILQPIRDASKEDPLAKTVDYQKTFPYRHYGVYALPFLIGEIRERNSAECFNAFLIITFHRDLYEPHYTDPLGRFPSVDEKMQFIRSWWRDHRQKFDRLGELSAKIDAQLAQSR